MTLLCRSFLSFGLFGSFGSFRTSCHQFFNIFILRPPIWYLPILKQICVWSKLVDAALQPSVKIVRHEKLYRCVEVWARPGVTAAVVKVKTVMSVKSVASGRYNWAGRLIIGLLLWAGVIKLSLLNTCSDSLISRHSSPAIQRRNLNWF